MESDSWIPLLIVFCWLLRNISSNIVSRFSLPSDRKFRCSMEFWSLTCLLLDRTLEVHGVQEVVILTYKELGENDSLVFDEIGVKNSHHWYW
jgi:hypothetical protein